MVLERGEVIQGLVRPVAIVFHLSRLSYRKVSTMYLIFYTWFAFVHRKGKHKAGVT